LTAVMRLNYTHAPPKPVLLKIAPDLNETQLDDIISIVQSTGISGIVATNTTILREGLKTNSRRIDRIGAGGLSGKPVRKMSTDVIKYIHQKSKGTIPVMGVGGIHTPEDAVEKIKAGAPLIQLYTGFIYEGPYIAKRIKKYLSQQAV
ncbi:MAG: dihydroorotate dehydrogenase (quinone), partial [Flavobacteriales bacterium]